MKFKTVIDINQSKLKTVEIFEKPDNMKYWQDGFESFKHISGEENQPGSKYRILYDMGKRGKMELIETLLEYNMPDSMYAEFDHSHMRNTVRVTFQELDASTTRMHYMRWIT